MSIKDTSLLFKAIDKRINRYKFYEYRKGSIMDSYDGQVTCSRCRKILLLKKEDINFKITDPIKELTSFASLPTKIFFANCIDCNNTIYLSSFDISPEAKKNAKKIDDVNNR